MFLLDSLMISGIQWALKTVVAAAEAEMNDDSALRDRLMEAEMQREMGEITDDEFVEIEADLLKAIREIKERRDGGSGAFAFGAGQPIETDQDSRFQIEAEFAGDFYGETDRSDRSEPSAVATSPTPPERPAVEPPVVSPARPVSKSTTGALSARRTARTTRTTKTTKTIRASRRK